MPRRFSRESQRYTIFLADEPKRRYVSSGEGDDAVVSQEIVGVEASSIVFFDVAPTRSDS